MKIKLDLTRERRETKTQWDKRKAKQDSLVFPGSFLEWQHLGKNLPKWGWRNTSITETTTKTRDPKYRTLILNSWAPSEVSSSSGTSPPAAVAYIRKNKKDIWDGSTPNTDLLHTPISSFSSGKQEARPGANFKINVSGFSHVPHDASCSPECTLFDR